MTSFLLEVGTEELPASFISSAIEQWQNLVPASLQENLLTSSSVQVMGTPRRLAVLVQGLPEQQPDQEEDVKGPAARAAFKDGQPTQAAMGFARSRGVDISELKIRKTDKGDFVFVQQKIAGRPTAAILTELVPQWLAALEGKRFMRWGAGELRFSRPIRWLVALLDDQVLPITLVNQPTEIHSGRESRGHRVLHPQPVQINHAEDYLNALEKASVIVEPEQRRTQIQQQIQTAAAQLGGRPELSPELLAEVVELVEYPTAVVGKFEDEFLKLPVEVITTVMVTHQRYVPVFANTEPPTLLPNFITISNGDPTKSAMIAQGNERVIRARLADAQFFYQADLAQPLAAYLPKLETVTFHAKLGSVAVKVERIGQAASLIMDELQLTGGERVQIQTAAKLCKADLVTQMVGEFPELQGVMGQKYALASGEPEAVATAIFEHYLPRGAGDQLPQTLAGQVVGLADRLDALVSIFGLGMLPSGSSDPFALRRAANGILNIVWAAGLPLNLGQLLPQLVIRFVQSYPESTPAEQLSQQLEEFFLQRLRSLLQEEQGLDYDLVNAVLGENDPDYTQRALADVLDTRTRVQFLQTCRRDGRLERIYETINRATRLARQGNLALEVLDPKDAVAPNQLEQPAEQAFHQALLALLPKVKAAQQARNYEQVVAALLEIAPTVSRFFDGPESVLVMAEDPAVRRNRLNLLGLLRNHARILADFGAVVKS